MMNKSHPDYPKYEKAFWEIVKKEQEETEKFDKENPPKKGLKYTQREHIHKKYVLKIKELQKKYSYLADSQ